MVSFIAIRWLTVQYCVITFSHAESDMSDFTAVLPIYSKSCECNIQKFIKVCKSSATQTAMYSGHFTIKIGLRQYRVCQHYRVSSDR